MRLSILGASAVRPNRHAACSGYLLESAGRAYLVDCGSGVVGQLLAFCDPADLDGVLISHSHPDHCTDLVAIRMALVHAPGPKRDVPLPVFAGPETRQDLLALGEVFGDGFWEPALDLLAFDPRVPLALGDVVVRFAPTAHYRPCWAMRFECGDRVLTYTADSGPTDALVDISRGADLLLSEATLPERAGYEDQWGHMSAGEAGALAAEAGARRLLLTHYFEEHDPERLRAAAATAFGPSVDVAREGDRHDV